MQSGCAALPSRYKNHFLESHLRPERVNDGSEIVEHFRFDNTKLLIDRRNGTLI